MYQWCITSCTFISLNSNGRRKLDKTTDFCWSHSVFIPQLFFSQWRCPARRYQILGSWSCFDPQEMTPDPSRCRCGGALDVFLGRKSVTGWWFGTWLLFFHISWEFDYPDWLSYFSEALKPPTRSVFEDVSSGYPLVNKQKTMERSTIL